jgi:preprotein translocase subunit SecG
MGVIKAILIIIEVITCVLLVGVILLQKSKDEGLGLAFGAGVGETLFGSRAGNVLTKITIGLAAVFLIDTLLIGFLIAGGRSGGSVTDRLPLDRPAAAPVQMPAPAPGPAAALPETPAPAPAEAPAQPVAPVTPAPAPAPATP